MGRKNPRKKGQPGGRYTPPKASLPQETTVPVVRRTPIALSHVARSDEDSKFWAGYEVAERALRERCAALLGEHPPTDEEWSDAVLLEMDGQDASDEELVAYWRTHRRAMELDLLEPPELRFIIDALAVGEDPAVTYVQGFEDDDGE